MSAGSAIDSEGRPRWNDAAGSAAARAAQRRASLAILAWAVSLAAATLALGTGSVPAGFMAWLVAAAPSLVGAACVLLFIRFLRVADELVRKIQVEALALGFGAGLVAMFGYRLLERAGAPKLDISDAGLVMVLAWGLGQWLGARRYW